MANQIILKAMPRLIKPKDLTKSYIDYIRQQVQPLVGTTQVTKLDIDGMELNFVEFSPTQGTYFTTDRTGKVTFVYHYQSLSFRGIATASEALAYKWGLAPFTMKDTFFKYMLPKLRFIVTDSEYTPAGARWFKNQYAFAFAKGFPVYLLDMQLHTLKLISQEEFEATLPNYWGRGERFTRWRFAISLDHI